MKVEFTMEDMFTLAGAPKIENLVKFEGFFATQRRGKASTVHTHSPNLELVSERGGYVSPEVQIFAQICSISPAGTTR